MPAAPIPTAPPGYKLVRDNKGKRGRPAEYGVTPAGARRRTLPPLTDQEWAAVRGLVRSMRNAD
jgi:hypothetical protein